MIKSTSNAQVELRMDGALKSTFLPPSLLGMEGGNSSVITTNTHYCPMCGQQFEHLQHANEHLQLCHGVIATILAPTHHFSAEQLKMDYPCLNCDERCGSAQELDEHHRQHHAAQTAATFLARCLSCGIYGFSTTALQQHEDYKCMHCGSICSAGTLLAGQHVQQQQLAAVAASYMEQPQAPTTPDELPAIPPQEMNSNHHHHQQQQQQLEQQQQHEQDNSNGQQCDKTTTETAVALDQRRVPPLTVRLNKSIVDGIETHAQVVIKQEPLSRGENSCDAADVAPTCVPVYTIQQTGNVANPTVTTTAAAAATNATTIATVMVGNKVRHKCADCPKTFKTPGTLAMHRKVHTGEADHTPKERPFICSYCGKSFTQSNTLKQHTRIHTGEKPFQCVYCEKSFSVKDYLTKHIRTHTGEKPYTCPYCEKRFTQRSALTVHTSKLHPL